MNMVLLLISAILLSSCGEFLPKMKKKPEGETLIVQQPSSEGVVNQFLEADFKLKFRSTENTYFIPVVYDIKAYTDRNCSQEASGKLTYEKQELLGELTVSNIKYSLPEDIYLGIDGTRITKACSSKVSFMSAKPVYFLIDSGDNQSVSEGTEIGPIAVRIFDIDDIPVKNAKVKIGDLFSEPSDENGLSLITPKVDNSAGSKILTITLYDGEIPLHSLSVNVNVLAGNPSRIEIYDQEDALETYVDSPSNPFMLQVFDSNNNIVYPSFYRVEASFYLNNTCSIPGPELTDFAILDNPVLDIDDTDSWTVLFIYMFSEVGNFNLKFELYDLDNNFIDSVCSQRIEIIE